MPDMYKPGRPRPHGRPDTLARLQQKTGDVGEAYGSLLHLIAALYDKAEGKHLDPRDYHAHLDGDQRPGGLR